jgi:hypothetical protein
MKGSTEYYQRTKEKLNSIINDIGKIQVNIFNFKYSNLQLMRLRNKVDKAEYYIHELNTMLDASIL